MKVIPYLYLDFNGGLGKGDAVGFGRLFGVLGYERYVVEVIRHYYSLL